MTGLQIDFVAPLLEFTRTVLAVVLLAVVMLWSEQ